MRKLREMPEPVDEPLPSEAEAAGGLVPAAAGAAPPAADDARAAVPFVACPSYRRSRRGFASSTRSCRASPVLQAGPAHIATLKTFDPPLRELDGRRFEGARRRGKWLLFPTDDGELQLRST